MNSWLSGSLLRWLMLISGVATVLGIAVVVTLIDYRRIGS
jgi:hypothetical protein